MSFQRVSAWFLTDAGKKCSYILAGGISTSVMIGHLLPHTFLIEQYKNFVHLYRKGLSVPISPKILKQFETALELVQIKPEDRHLFRPFHVVGFDVVSAGTSYSKYGAVIGIPANFYYEDLDTIEKHRIKLNNEAILWETEAGEKLLSSLVISENAKLYAMAKEIKLRNTPKILIDSIYGTILTMATYAFSNLINTKFDLYKKPRQVRYIMYSLVGTFALGNYFFLKDFTNVWLQNHIDKELKNTSPIFIEGARDYYSKVLLRNMALRILMGIEGEKKYTTLGEEIHFIRIKNKPLGKSKEFFEQVEVA